MASGPILTTSGTGNIVSNDTSGIGPRLRFNTGTTQNSGAGLIGGVGANYTLVRGDWDFDISFHIQNLALASPSVRAWVGLFSGGGYESNSTPLLHYAAFRFATDVDATNYWRCVTDNGSGTPTVTVTTFASTLNPATVFRITYDSVAGEVKFYIDGVLRATHTTTLPSASQLLGIGCWITNLDTTNRYLRFMQLQLIHN